MPSTRFTDAVRMACTSRDCCRISRDTFSGRSFESMTPRTKRRYGRHQLLGVVHDEHAPHVELDAAPVVAVPQVERRPLRQVEQQRVFLPALDLRVHAGERRLEVVRHVLVELVVLLLGDVGLRARPQRRRLVDLLVLVGRDLLLARRRPTAPSS